MLMLVFLKDLELSIWTHDYNTVEETKCRFDKETRSW
jgi:hypothetical protein